MTQLASYRANKDIMTEEFIWIVLCAVKSSRNHGNHSLDALNLVIPGISNTKFGMVTGKILIKHFTSATTERFFSTFIEHRLFRIIVWISSLSKQHLLEIEMNLK